jgi:hypothetical protein
MKSHGGPLNAMIVSVILVMFLVWALFGGSSCAERDFNNPVDPNVLGVADVLTITSGPSGSPNPVASGGQVNCTVTAADTKGHSLSYSWSVSGGNVSSVKERNSTWTSPENNTSGVVNYSISVRVACTGGLSKSVSYQQSVNPTFSVRHASAYPGGILVSVNGVWREIAHGATMRISVAGNTTLDIYETIGSASPTWDTGYLVSPGHAYKVVDASTNQWDLTLLTE